MKNLPTYRLITGRRIAVSRLTDPERSLLTAAIREYRSGPEWSRFASWWNLALHHAKLDHTSPVYRICQDLEARLGIKQGKVSPPDYRDYLADLIEEKFGSRYKFCQEVGIDQGHLSRVLAGHAELSLQLLRRAAESLDSTLVIRRQRDIRKELNRDEVAGMLEEIT